LKKYQESILRSNFLYHYVELLKSYGVKVDTKTLYKNEVVDKTEKIIKFNDIKLNDVSSNDPINVKTDDVVVDQVVKKVIKRVRKVIVENSNVVSLNEPNNKSNSDDLDDIVVEVNNDDNDSDSDIDIDDNDVVVAVVVDVNDKNKDVNINELKQLHPKKYAEIYKQEQKTKIIELINTDKTTDPLLNTINGRLKKHKIDFTVMKNNSDVRDIIINDDNYEKYMNFLYLNSSDEIIEQMIKDKNKNNFNVNMIGNNLMQIYFVNKLSKILGIDKFNLDIKIFKQKQDDIIKKEDGIKYLVEYKKLFKKATMKTKIEFWDDLYRIFFKSINSLCGDMIKIKTSQINSKLKSHRFINKISYGKNYTKFKSICDIVK